MTAKLIMSVRDINGIATVTYICKERKRLYECKLAELIAEFKKSKRGINSKARRFAPPAGRG